MFALVRHYRRAQLLKRPFPEAWEGHLQRRVPFYRQLPQPERARLRDLLKVFAWEKEWIGARGFDVTGEVKAVVSAVAVRLVLHLGLGHYDRLSEVILYASSFQIPETTGEILGEAKHWGQVILSWDSVLQGLSDPKDGRATATHEFAHVLDVRDGAFDGTPKLSRVSAYRPWAEVMSGHYFRLREAKRPEQRVLDDYGAKNEAEFFAVATEAFFEKPLQMKQHTPDLYDALRAFYGWDPAQNPPQEWET